MIGFKQMDDEYLLKEIAFIPLNKNGDPVVYLFKKPYPWRRLSDEMKADNIQLKHSHGIAWNTDGLDYSEVANVLHENLQDATKIFVLSEFKRKWLLRFKFSAHNIHHYGYPSNSSFKCVTICTNHNPIYKTVCALHNVKLMKLFYLSHIHL